SGSGGASWPTSPTSAGGAAEPGRGAARRDPPPGRPPLASLLEETRRLGRLVDDLHTLALAETGRLVLRRGAGGGRAGRRGRRGRRADGALPGDRRRPRVPRGPAGPAVRAVRTGGRLPGQRPRAVDRPRPDPRPRR